MADDRHLEWLDQGVDAWNRRRRETPFTPDFSGADLVRRPLLRYNLSGANLRRADLHSANLQHADLEGADLTEANLYRSDMRGARLERANFHRATLKRAKLDRCLMGGARLYGADLTLARLDETDLRGADLRAWLPPKPGEPRNKFDAFFGKGATPIVTITTAQLLSAAGDAMTRLPDGVARPPHWAAEASDGRLALRATPAAEFDWREDGRLGATRLEPIAPRPQPGSAEPLDLAARDQQLATVGLLAEQIAASLEAYGQEGGHNFSAVAKNAAAPMRLIAAQCAKAGDQVLISFVRANIDTLKRLSADDAEALADVDRAMLAQLLVEWERLVPFYPILGEIDNPRRADIAPEGAEHDADSYVERVKSAVNSEAGREILSDEARRVFEMEIGDDAPPTTAEGKRRRLVNVAALVAALGHAIDDAPRPVKRIGAFAGFALTVKELVELVAGWIF